MLSKSIKTVADTLEEEVTQGSVMTPTTQTRFVQVLRDWQTLAEGLEEPKPEPEAAQKPARRLQVVGGREHRS